MQSVGDMARSLVLRTNQVQLRQQMDKLAVEVATGFAKDSAKKLGGDTTSLLAIDRTLAKLDAYKINTTEATYVTTSMQNAMDEMQQRSQTLSQTLIAADLTPNSTLLKTMSDDAENAMAQVLNGMNRQVAGRFLFSGTATDQPAVQGVDVMMNELRTALTGATTAADVNTTLDTFFGAGGAFETTIYQGSNNGLSPMQLSETESASVDIKATDQAFRDILKPMAMAAIATDGTLGLSGDVQVDLLAQSGRDLLGAQTSIVELRASLGALEGRIEETVARNSAEITSTQLARLELVGVDEFETATKYESVRGQLESLYAITARSQRLSLAEYL